jgi:hypothetical protein
MPLLTFSSGAFLGASPVTFEVHHGYVCGH